jgi:hypothetical protein
MSFRTVRILFFVLSRFFSLLTQKSWIKRIMCYHSSRHANTGAVFILSVTLDCFGIKGIKQYSTRTYTMTKPLPPDSQLKPLPPKERAKLLIKLGVLKAPNVKKYRVAPKPKPTGKPTSTYRKTIECVETGEVFPSITAAAQAHGVKPSNLCWHIKGYNASVGGKTYRHTTLPTPPIPHDQRMRKQVRCIDDGQTFPSLNSAARHYNLSPNSISLHLRGVQRSAKGKRFEYV